MTKEGVMRIKKFLGIILYYSGAADLTTLMLLSTIASEQAKSTKTTIKKTKQLLDYLATNPDSTMRFYASGMIIKINSDVSYLSA